MGDLIKGIEFLDTPTTIAGVLVLLFLVMQVIGKILEFKGKIVPEFMNIHKHFVRKRKEREETSQTLKEVKQLLNDVNQHYSSDNITKRDSWMSWVNNRAEVYDNSIVEITNKLEDATQALRDNTKMTEEMFVQSSRDRIIDFAAKVGDENAVVSREEFHRIFKVYDKYEQFLKERKLTNGEIDIAYRIIKEAYEIRLKNHSFIEDIRGYDK